METWKPIPGYEGRYEVSDQGRVRSLDRVVPYSDGRRKPARLKGNLLVCGPDPSGYPKITLPGGYKKTVHRIVAEVFLPPIEFPRKTVNHKNGIRHDNRVDNLEWATYKENADHARQTGLNKQHGENCNLAKFNDALVEAVKRVHQEYAPSYQKLGELFGMSQAHAWEIVKGTTRKKKTP